MAEANRQRANEIIGRVTRAIKDYSAPTSREFVIGAILSRDIGALEDENSSLRDEIASLREECGRLLDLANEAEAQVRDVRKRNAELLKEIEANRIRGEAAESQVVESRNARDKWLESAHEIEQEARDLRQRNAALMDESARVCREAERILSEKKELAQENMRLDLDRCNWRTLAHQFADVLVRGEETRAESSYGQYERRLEAALPLARAVVDQEPTTEPLRGGADAGQAGASPCSPRVNRAGENLPLG